MENDKSNITFETLKLLIEFYEIDLTSLDLEKFILEGELKKIEAPIPVEHSKPLENVISTKLIHQMEERIVDLKDQNDYLKSRLNTHQQKIQIVANLPPKSFN